MVGSHYPSPSYIRRKSLLNLRAMVEHADGQDFQLITKTFERCYKKSQATGWHLCDPEMIFGLRGLNELGQIHAQRDPYPKTGLARRSKVQERYETVVDRYDSFEYHINWLQTEDSGRVDSDGVCIYCRQPVDKCIEKQRRYREERAADVEWFIQELQKRKNEEATYLRSVPRPVLGLLPTDELA